MEKMPAACIHSCFWSITELIIKALSVLGMSWFSQIPRSLVSFVHISNVDLNTMSEDLDGVLDPKHKKDNFIKQSPTCQNSQKKCEGSYKLAYIVYLTGWPHLVFSKLLYSVVSLKSMWGKKKINIYNASVFLSVQNIYLDIIK